MSKVEYKTISYSTFNNKTDKEENYDQPKAVERELNNLAFHGWQVWQAFNTNYGIELLLCRVIGDITPKELAKEKKKELLRVGVDDGYQFNTWN